MPTARPALVLAALACLLSCSNEATTGAVQASGAGQSGNGGKLDPKMLILKTDLGVEEVRAGKAAPVTCRTFAPAANGAAAGELGAEVALPQAATVVVQSGPGLPLAVTPKLVKLAVAGEYVVQCRLPTLGLQDVAPPTLYVVPGPAVSLDTQWVGVYGQPPSPKPATVAAGTLIQTACAAHDSYNNLISSGFSLLATPAQAAAPSGLVAAATKAGPLALACSNEGFVDDTALQLQVVANVPRHLFTLLEPDTIVAGNASALTCVANDAYGNAIADFPFSLDFPATVTIKGLYATATKAGAHKIVCVPETLDWTLFTLHPATLMVQPGPPVKLQVQAVPAKVVYKQEEKVQFLSAVTDSFGNIVPEATVQITVLSPAKGWKLMDDKTVKFALDAKYKLHFQVVQADDLQEDRTIIVDGTPPLLTIEYPPWGATLEGKASVPVKGTAGDATSGIKTLMLNNKNVYVSNKTCQLDTDCAAGTCNPDTYSCTVGTWSSQFGAKHGLNRLEAKTADIGGEAARATRGFYYSGAYYPVDGTKPDSALVPDGMQVFLGHDFFDDGDHNPLQPNDLATLMELAIGGLDPNTLLPPGGLSQGGVDVTLSNIKYDKPKISLQTVDGGLTMDLVMANLSTDIAVKATQKIGPISVTLKVSGDIKIQKILISAGIGMSVINGFAEAKVTKSSAKIEVMKLHIDGLGGLFDFLWNVILDAYEGQIADQLVAEMNKQIPKLVGGLLAQFAINQAIPLPAAVKGGKDVTIQFISTLKTLQFTHKGGLVLMDAGFVSALGTTHKIAGAIARSGCIGTVEDTFAIDQKQRMQVALHDDVMNQMLHAIWYAGGLKMDKLDLAALGKPGAGSPIPLDGATLDLDLFLPPIVESCGMADPLQMKIQVGDAYIVATVPLGDPPLALGFFASFDIGAAIALGKSAEGKPQLNITLDKSPQYQLELFSIAKDFESQKQMFEDMVGKLLGDQLAKGLPGLDKLNLDLPNLDIGGLIPGLPAGAKIALVLKNLKRSGGYTAIDAELQ